MELYSLALERIEDDDGSALLRIPEDFSVNLIEGNPTSLELIRNPAQGIMPEVAEQLAGVLAEVLSSGSRVLREPLDTLAPFTQDRVRINEETVASIAVAVHGTIEGAESFLFPIPWIDQVPDTSLNSVQTFVGLPGLLYLPPLALQQCIEPLNTCSWIPGGQQTDPLF